MSFTPGSALHPVVNLAPLLETKKHCYYTGFSSPPSRHFHAQDLWQQVAGAGWGRRRRPCGLSSSQAPGGAPLAPHTLPLSPNLSSSQEAGGCLLLC